MPGLHENLWGRNELMKHDSHGSGMGASVNIFLLFLLETIHGTVTNVHGATAVWKSIWR